MKTLILFLIKTYKLLISPFLGQNCRFEPSCSQYTIEAVEKHGALKGSTLGVKRICRCHPWNEGGLDLVPEPNAETGEKINDPSHGNGIRSASKT